MDNLNLQHCGLPGREHSAKLPPQGAWNPKGQFYDQAWVGHDNEEALIYPLLPSLRKAQRRGNPGMSV